MIGDKIREIIKQEVVRVMGELAQTRHGLIDDYDKKAHAVRVRFQPEDRLSGWLPIPTQWVGPNWGMYTPPSVGDQVQITSHDGSHETGSMVARLFSDVDTPLEVDSGELWQVHQNGAFFKLTNDGKVSINSNGNNNTNSEISAGDLSKEIHQLVIDTMVELFNNHTHGGVTPGSGHTSVPDQKMGQDQLTQIFKAN